VSVAKRFYSEVLGAKVIDERSTPNRKQSAFVAVGEDTVVELAQPTSSNTAEARDLERSGEGIFALTFKTRNLAKAADFLRSKQLRADHDGDDSIVLGQDQAFGMTIGFTERSLPNDPRVS
jgi:catechol 2,3-dioxygenase-like lactoylglutathione lyase family enzyme